MTEGHADSWASSDGARATMKANRGRDTTPELRLRRVLHATGLRYRVDWPLPFDRRRRADIAFTKQRVAVFVDGCFWHGCPEHFVTPKANADFWARKIKANRTRDMDSEERLRSHGWTVLRCWEHEDSIDVAAQVAMVVRACDG